MEYRLKRGERAPEGVRRMAAEQLDKALEHLACQDGKGDKHIHEARKATKRLRALMRLVRRSAAWRNSSPTSPWYTNT